MITSHRHTGISDSIDLEKLEHESYKLLYFGLVIAVIIHGIVGMLIPYKAYRVGEVERKAVKHIPVNLIVLPPKIRNPFETWKLIIPGKEPLRKRFISRIPSMKYKPPSPLTLGELGKLLLPQDNYFKDYGVKIHTEIDIGLSEKVKALIDPKSFKLEPYFKNLRITRIPSRSFSLEEEMLTLDDIDHYGIYKGFVIRNPNDKQGIKGFVYIPVLQGSALHDAVAGLAYAVEFCTNIQTSVDGGVSLESVDMLDYPIIYFSSNSLFRLNETERKNLREYLTKGGFAILDNGEPWYDFKPGEASLYLMLLDTLGNKFNFEPVPFDHPLNFCFYDLGALLPEGAETWASTPDSTASEWGFLNFDAATYRTTDHMHKKVNTADYSLWGVWIGERLAAVYSDRGYGHLWEKYPYTLSNESISPQVKLGVNLVVYALTQKDGIAQSHVNYGAHRSQDNKKLKK